MYPMSKKTDAIYTVISNLESLVSGIFKISEEIRNVELEGIGLEIGKELKDLNKSGLILSKGQVMTDLWQSKMLGRIKEDILV